MQGDWQDRAGLLRSNAVAVGQYGGYFANSCKPKLKKILKVCRLLIRILCSIVHTQGKEGIEHDDDFIG